MVKNIDWCVKNVFSSSDDDNFGRCVLHSSNLSCQQLVQVGVCVADPNIFQTRVNVLIKCTRFQGNQFTSYYVSNEEVLNNDVLSSMNDAVTVYPLKNVQTFYTLHSYFSKVSLNKESVLSEYVQTLISDN